MYFRGGKLKAGGRSMRLVKKTKGPGSNQYSNKSLKKKKGGKKFAIRKSRGGERKGQRRNGPN